MSPFQEVEHTADWALHVWGTTREELFVAAAQGMYALMGVQLQTPAPVWREIQVQAADYEALLVAWLQELLFSLESAGVAFAPLRVIALTPTRLTVVAEGEAPVRVSKLIKAVTYHNLHIQPRPEGYETTIVFDV